MASIVQSNFDRRCRNVDLAKLAGEIVSWEKYAPFFGLSPPEEEEIKRDSRQYVVQKRRMLERWKETSGDSATYRNLIGIFERVGDQSLANYVYELAQHHEAQPYNRRQKPIFCLDHLDHLDCLNCFRFNLFASASELPCEKL